LAEPGLDFAGYFLVLGGLVSSRIHELLIIGQKLIINHSASPNSQCPIAPV
jgi:hypothetical protein